MYLRLRFTWTSQQPSTVPYTPTLLRTITALYLRALRGIVLVGVAVWSLRWALDHRPSGDAKPLQKEELEAPRVRKPLGFLQGFRV